MPGQDWIDAMRDIGQDLITIEVNTIESTEISGRKMPGYPHALIDVAQKYAKFLTSAAIGLELDALAWAFMQKTDTPRGKNFDLVSPVNFKTRVEFRKNRDQDLDDKMAAIMDPVEPEYIDGTAGYTVRLTNGWETFELLRWAANKSLAIGRPSGQRASARQAGSAHTVVPTVDSKTRGILWRIARNCDQLKGVADDLRSDQDIAEFIGRTRRSLVSMDKTPKAAPPQHLTRIRKAWDIGTDLIVMQTVVQLDGDITYRTWPDLVPETKAALLDAHERATHVGVGHWQSLFQLVFDLISKGFGRLFPGKT